jgi:hypothetical protein
MLNEDEVIEEVRHFEDRKEFFAERMREASIRYQAQKRRARRFMQVDADDDDSDHGDEERTIFEMMHNELGVPDTITRFIVQHILEEHYTVPADLIGMMQPQAATAVWEGICIGIMLGKRVAKESRTCE